MDDGSVFFLFNEFMNGGVCGCVFSWGDPTYMGILDWFPDNDRTERSPYYNYTGPHLSH